MGQPLGPTITWGGWYVDSYTKIKGVAVGWAEYQDGRRDVMLEWLQDGKVASRWFAVNRLVSVENGSQPGQFI